MQTKNKSILWLTLALWMIFLAPWTFAQGIFVDGLYYGTIARNWYFEGSGNWDFYLSKTQFNPFQSHPPLAFWLQGCLFSILGDVWYCDRLYSFLICLLSGLAMLKTWALFNKSNSSWLPLLCWLLIPTVLWSFNNNLLENTLTAACSWAVYCTLYAVKNPKAVLFAMLGVGIFTFLGLMSKGPAAAFPLILPFFCLIYYKKKLTWSSGFNLVLPTITVVLLFIALLTFSEGAEAYFSAYWDIQVMGSLSGTTEISNSRFFILYRLFEELAILAILISIAYFYQNKKRKTEEAGSFFRNKDSGLFLFIALSASLPILISPKQMGFYLLPSTPFWALTAASLLWPAIESKVAGLPCLFHRANSFIAGFLLALAITLSIFNYKTGYTRDKEKLAAIAEIIEIVPAHQQLDMSYSLYKEWSLYGYFYRIAYISIEATDKPIGNYYLLKKGEKMKLKGYRELRLKESAAALFRLYVRG